MVNKYKQSCKLDNNGNIIEMEEVRLNGDISKIIYEYNDEGKFIGKEVFFNNKPIDYIKIINKEVIETLEYFDDCVYFKRFNYFVLVYCEKRNDDKITILVSSVFNDIGLIESLNVSDKYFVNYKYDKNKNLVFQSDNYHWVKTTYNEDNKITRIESSTEWVNITYDRNGDKYTVIQTKSNGMSTRQIFDYKTHEWFCQRSNSGQILYNERHLYNEMDLLIIYEDSNGSCNKYEYDKYGDIVFYNGNENQKNMYLYCNFLNKNVRLEYDVNDSVFDVTSAFCLSNIEGRLFFYFSDVEN